MVHTLTLNPHAGFDPLGMAQDTDSFNKRQVTEVKNGRLAMIAISGITLNHHPSPHTLNITLNHHPSPQTLNLNPFLHSQP